MASLEEDIGEVKREIDWFKAKLAKAEDEGDTAREDKLLVLITSSRETLNRLLDKQARGKVLFLRRSSRLLNNALFSGSI